MGFLIESYNFYNFSNYSQLSNPGIFLSFIFCTASHKYSHWYPSNLFHAHIQNQSHLSLITCSSHCLSEFTLSSQQWEKHPFPFFTQEMLKSFKKSCLFLLRNSLWSVAFPPSPLLPFLISGLHQLYPWIIILVFNVIYGILFFKIIFQSHVFKKPIPVIDLLHSPGICVLSEKQKSGPFKCDHNTSLQQLFHIALALAPWNVSSSSVNCSLGECFHVRCSSCLLFLECPPCLCYLCVTTLSIDNRILKGTD